MKKILILVLILNVQNLNGRQYKIKGDHLYIIGEVQISKIEYFNDSDYNSIEIFVYYKAHHDNLVIGKTTVGQGGQYGLKIKIEELMRYSFMNNKRKIKAEKNTIARDLIEGRILLYNNNSK